MIPRMTTKEVIIKVAGDLFMDKGFQATSTREIAEKAGITQPNLYHHFKTKEAIYIAVLEDLSLEVKIELNQLVDATMNGPLVERLQAILDYLREKHPVNFFIMSHDMTHEISSENHHHLYKIWQESYLSPIIRLFDEYVQAKFPLSSNDLARYYYATIAPFIQKESGFYKQITSEQIIYLFVYGILDREENSNKE